MKELKCWTKIFGKTGLCHWSQLWIIKQVELCVLAPFSVFCFTLFEFRRKKTLALQNGNNTFQTRGNNIWHLPRPETWNGFGLYVSCGISNKLFFCIRNFWSSLVFAIFWCLRKDIGSRTWILVEHGMHWWKNVWKSIWWMPNWIVSSGTF